MKRDTNDKPIPFVCMIILVYFRVGWVSADKLERESSDRKPSDFGKSLRKHRGIYMNDLERNNARR